MWKIGLCLIQMLSYPNGKNDFQKLYNPLEDDSNKYDNEFYYFIKGQVNELRRNSDGVDENVYLNDLISFDKIEKNYCKTKIRESMRIRFKKNTKVFICLWYLFTKCFEIGIVSSMWAGAPIKPIHKSRGKDPCVPLNYRGLSFLCTISKVYSSVLNNRINKYFNMVNLISNYQNVCKSLHSFFTFTLYTCY